MKIKRLFFFLYLSLIFQTISYGQEPIYKHFGVDEGLPSSQIYDIYQTKDGYIWFATDKGLSRYNGYEFENFDTNDGLPGNVVLRFYPQKNGEIWAYTYHNKALFYFNEIFNGFTNYKHNRLISRELNSNAIIKSVFVDDSKSVKLGGHYVNGLLSISTEGTVKKLYSHENFYNELSQEYIVLNTFSQKKPSYFLTTDTAIADKSISASSLLKVSSHIDASWLIKNRKALFMNGTSIEIVAVDKKNKVFKTKYLPIGIKVIDSTQFFVGYFNGGGKIVNDKGSIIKEYLQEKSVTQFLIDHEGGYWFTTLNSGVYYIKKPAITLFKAEKQNSSLHINSLVKTKDELLIGYKNGSFAKIDANRNFKFEKALNDSYPSLVEYNAFSNKTYIYKNHKLFINGIFKGKSIPVKLSESTINNPVFLSNRSSFIEVDKGKIHFFSKRVQDVCVLGKDTLIATPFGIYQKLKNDTVALSKKSKLLGYRSDDIDVSKDGSKFFIATHGAGIVVYGKEIYNLSKKDGLTSNIVNEIHVENDSTIWACTNKGLNRIKFNNNSFKITNIDKNSGLLSNGVEDIEIINDTLWVGTKDGLCYMPKETLEIKKLDNIYLKLKEVKVNDVVYKDEKNVKLNYNENKITFSVQGISFANNNHLQYKYRLKEIDTKWSTTKNRNITFPNLKEGKYTFQVQACIENRCELDKQLEYRFTILPPFWKSWWFYAVCFFSFGALLYIFFKIRVLTYNKDVVREFFRLLIKKLKSDEKYLEIRMNGEDLKIPTKEILFIKSSGNYLDITSTHKTYTIRCKIGEFIVTTPDALEYLRIHRSYIIRIEKVTGKSKKTVTINEHIIPVGETYLPQLELIQF